MAVYWYLFTEGISTNSEMEWVSGSVLSPRAGERGQESALPIGAALSKAQGGEHGEQRGSVVPLPDSQAWLEEARPQPHTPILGPLHPQLWTLGPPYPQITTLVPTSLIFSKGTFKNG